MTQDPELKPNEDPPKPVLARPPQGWREMTEVEQKEWCDRLWEAMVAQADRRRPRPSQEGRADQAPAPPTESGA